MFCGYCGVANPDDADVRYCRACGGRLAEVLAPRESSARVNGGASIATFAAPALADPPRAEALTIAQPPTAPVSSTTATLPPARMLLLVSPYGGFWARFGAALLDGLAIAAVVVTIWGALLIALGLVATVDEEYAPGTELMLLSLILIGFLTSLLYCVASPPLAGATPGKLALGYRIVGSDGRRIGLQRSLARYFAGVLSAIALGLGYAWIGVDPLKRSWHDRIAGTYVIRRELARN